MILKWGSYAHDNNEVGVRIRVRSIFDTFGRRMGGVQDWDIIGAKHADSQSAITTALDSLETAYQTDYGDLVLYLDDGTTATQHAMMNADQFGGNHVTSFGYMDGPWKMRTEYANRRTFHATIRGEFRTGTGLYAWKERLMIKGTGGPKFRYMPSLAGAPVSQVLQQQTTYFYIQQGMAVGRYSYIAPPGPLWPAVEHLEHREIEYVTPEEIRYDSGTNTLIGQMYTTRWRYVMEATIAQTFSIFTLPGV